MGEILTRCCTDKLALIYIHFSALQRRFALAIMSLDPKLSCTDRHRSYAVDLLIKVQLNDSAAEN